MQNEMSSNKKIENKEPDKKVKPKLYYKGLTIEFTDNLFFPKKEKESKKKDTDLPK